MYLAVLLFCVFAGAESNLDLNIELCKRDDNACFTRVADSFYSAAIRGDSSLKIKALDPLHQDYIHGKFITIDYKLLNSTVIGFKDCQVKKTKAYLEKNRVDFLLTCPRIYMYGAYAISGLLIIVPIEGNGDYSLDTKDYHIQLETEIKILETDDGKRYLQYKNFRAYGDLRGGMVANLTNLFDGKNDELAQAAIKVLNEEWRPVSRELQGPVVNANIRKIMKNLNKYLRKVPLDKFIDY